MWDTCLHKYLFFDAEKINEKVEAVNMGPWTIVDDEDHTLGKFAFSIYNGWNCWKPES